MYYQIFISELPKGKQGQISCDNWNEVQEEVERKGRPRFVKVEYHNENGLYGTAWTMYSTLKETYITYRKIKSQR